MSYLERWWRDASQQSKTDFIRLVKSGQLEIVGGGWVMNDEANSHYFAIIEQVVALTLITLWLSLSEAMSFSLGLKCEALTAIQPNVES